MVEAKLKRDVETLGKMDPYTKIKWKDADSGEAKEFHSATLDNAGKNPHWGEEANDKNSISIRVKDFAHSTIEFAVKDSDLMSSAVVGYFETDYSALAFNGGADQWF